MAEIFVPGEEVERVGALLARVMGLIDTQNSGFDARAVGAPMVNAGLEFDRSWDDGRVRLKKNCTALKDACDVVLKSFRDLDTDMGNQLTDAQNGSGGTAPGTPAPAPSPSPSSEETFSAEATAGSVIA
ncbi:hypothetical protein AB0O01_32050 [Streptomyces sp. NPDC093252]|uniref:hypothetical protein n=1 Tax=Streptomyces sp. NPDC093252 TaxID=3154980 RepID=UPI003432A6B4